MKTVTVKQIKKYISGVMTAVMLTVSGTTVSFAEPLGQEISGMFCRTEEGGMFLTDGEGTVLGGPFSVISDYCGYPSAVASDGTKTLFDLDGSVLCSVPAGGEILCPSNGVYAIMPDTEDSALCHRFLLYDYATRELLATYDGFINIGLEQQTDKMFLQRDGKYAIVDCFGRFYTDFIYDAVLKRYNPDYLPFPRAYAIVEQDGVKKYLDAQLNEIDLDNDHGAPFITNSYRLPYAFAEGYYKNYYILESGEKTALYDLDTETFLTDYQSEYQFRETNGRYVTIFIGETCGVIDMKGNIVFQPENGSIRFSDETTAVRSYFDGEGSRTEILHLDKGTREPEPRTYKETMPYYESTDFDTRSEVAGACMVFNDGTCADLSGEDLERLLDAHWNFTYYRIVAPRTVPAGYECYIKLWNEDRSKEAVMYDYGTCLVGRFGTPYQAANGEIKENFVWYAPYRGNARNALYTLWTELMVKYRAAARPVTEQDLVTLPGEDRNLLPLEGSSSWAKTEIEKTAACNLMLWELSDHYTEPISRREFCKLAVRLIVTHKAPEADSSSGYEFVLNELREETAETEEIFYSDCADAEIRLLTALNIVNGVGDGRFSPDRDITRVEAALILNRLAGYLKCSTADTADSLVYADRDSISSWARESVDSMSSMGIMKGTSDSLFSPKGSYTVEQAIATMVRLYEHSLK